MNATLEFIDGPPPKSERQRRAEATARLVAELKAHPTRWARVPDDVCDACGGHLSLVVAADDGCLDPDGRVTFHRAADGSLWAVWCPNDLDELAARHQRHPSPWIAAACVACCVVLAAILAVGALS